MKEYFFTEKGLYYRMNEFREERETLVFVHGLSGSSSAWLAYEKYFEERYNILSFDLRGHGKSIKYTHYKDYRINNFVEDMRALITHIQISHFVLISNSFSTLIALEYLEKYPENILAHIFIGPSFNVNKGFLPKLLRLFLPLSRIFELFPASQKPGTHVDYSKHRNTTDWDIRRSIADISNTTLRIYLYSTYHAYEVNKENFLETITAPTLIIHGQKDTIFPVRNSEIMAEKIKNATLIILPPSDHITVLNNASEICQAMDNFLNQNNI